MQGMLHKYMAQTTRKLSYHKDDPVMCPTYGARKFSRVPEYAHGYFFRNC